MARGARRLVLGLSLVAVVVVPLRAAGAPRPLDFSWPTGVEVENGGTLLVVENGTGSVDRVDVSTGRRSVVATIGRAYRTASSSGSVFVSATDSVWRIGPTGAKRKLVDADQAGPIAATARGDVYFTATGGVFSLMHGAGPARRLARTARIQGAHGIAATPGGALLVSDTNHDRILRIDPSTGRIAVLARVADPRGVAVAADGTVYVVAAGSRRVLHLDAHGSAIGYVGARFGDPYDLALGADGSVYVVDTAAIGSVKRIAPGGKTTVIAAGRA
jgi:DNA-binding beta-propeller fold protein YncE